MLLGGPPASRKALADPDEPVRSTSNGDGSITLGADDRPLEADDGAGGLTRLRPDLAGHPAEDRPFWRRTTLATDQLGRRISRTFDDQGNLAELAVLGGAVRTFAHDALSRLQGVTDPAGATSRRPSTRRASAGSFSRDVATAETILVNGLDGAPRSSATSAGAWRQSPSDRVHNLTGNYT
ncbi:MULTISPECIES: RHS repeat protein [unclassified Curtobacterium]|uniref:RHS repeat protein n=1 Tax=unclassified Curtobacterium TaxID=257496 RepID=UPI001053AEF9|nr:MULTISPECIES: RHS repeat protein [unclassified Curtobacterium]